MAIIILSDGSEEFKTIKEQWEKEAKEMTLEALPKFLKRLTEEYRHDYGTICSAMAVGAVATAYAVNKTPQGGITGFQAGAVMWDFISGWLFKDNKIGLTLINYDDLLYPQYEDSCNTISSEIWKNLQKEAKKEIEKADKAYKKYLLAVSEYEENMSIFIKKYPDYLTRKKLVMGNNEDWERERKKIESGFVFAPEEPYVMVDPNNNVYKHWVSIVNGEVPFGYTLKNEE